MVNVVWSYPIQMSFYNLGVKKNIIYTYVCVNVLCVTTLSEMSAHAHHLFKWVLNRIVIGL